MSDCETAKGTSGRVLVCAFPRVPWEVEQLGRSSSRHRSKPRKAVIGGDPGRRTVAWFIEHCAEQALAGDRNQHVCHRQLAVSAVVSRPLKHSVSWLLGVRKDMFRVTQG